MKLAGFFLFLSVLCFSGAESESIYLATGSFDPFVNQISIPESLRAEIPTTGETYYLIQFKSLPQESWIQDLSRLAKFYGYYPENAYLIKARPSDIASIQANPSVRWVGPYLSSYKLSPDIGQRPVSPIRKIEGKLQLVVELLPDSNADSAVSQISKLGGTEVKIFQQENSARIKVLFPAAMLADLARIPEVQWVEEEGERKVRDEKTSWVIQSNINSNTPIWDRGLHGEGQMIGHIDLLINNASCYLSGPIGTGKIEKIHNQSNFGSVNSHGIETAGIAVGNNDQVPSGSDPADGGAFEARITHTNVCDVDPSECDKTGSGVITLEQALINDHNDGARVHTNSWGDDQHNSYSADCRDIDHFSRTHEDDLVIFAVANQTTIESPENAKNVLAVGASGQAGTTPNQDQHSSGGHGPTAGSGRRKPEIYAPGFKIISASTSSCGTASNLSGTSMATPAIAAAAALTRQYYVEGWYPSGTKKSSDSFAPSGALVKATLLNGTVDMTGITFNGQQYPNDSEGWGRLLLDNALFFDGNARSLIVDDVRNASGLSNGNTATYSFSIGSGQPLKVTLVWTDPESAAGSTGNLTNNLNLEVTTPDGTFKGNVFSGGQSATGGSFDTKNNVEQVLIKSPTSGNLTIKIIAASVPTPKQGYAVVISGGVTECSSAPAPPTGLAATPGQNQISLSWDSSSADSYKIYRNTTNCSSFFDFLADSTDTSFVDSPLSAANTYHYQVRAVQNGCLSPPSACETASPNGTAFLFFDDFGDGRSASDWTVTGNGSAIINGQQQFQLTGTDKITAAPNFDGCDDCELSFDLAIDSGKPYIFFPNKDNDNYRQLIFMIDKGKAVLKEKVNGVKTNKESFALPSQIKTGSLFHVIIHNNGNNVTVTIGSQVFGPFPMSNFSSTSFQFQSKKGKSRFDDVLVQ